MSSLGRTLKTTREEFSLTLKEVEVSTGISNAYLSQLENGKIKKPSASVLYKLSEVYRIKLDVLLAAAGIIDPTSVAEPSLSELEKEFSFYKDQFDQEEQQEILNFVRFIRFRKQQNPTSGRTATSGT
jgi:transcriptional regulator with XRE-family HTH domain